MKFNNQTGALTLEGLSDIHTVKGAASFSRTPTLKDANYFRAYDQSPYTELIRRGDALLGTIELIERNSGDSIVERGDTIEFRIVEHELVRAALRSLLDTAANHDDYLLKSAANEMLRDLQPSEIDRNTQP